MEEKKIPNLGLNERREVVDETKEVPLKVNGEEVFVTLRKISTGERNKIKSESTTVRIIGGQPNVTVNHQEVQEKILTASIIKAPFEINVNSIKKLPAEVSDYLFNEYEEFAEPTEQKKSELSKD